MKETNALLLLVVAVVAAYYFLIKKTTTAPASGLTTTVILPIGNRALAPMPALQSTSPLGLTASKTPLANLAS